MGRNYFSKHGGPYFINDGFSRHTHSHDESDKHESDSMFWICLSIAFVGILGAIGIIINSLF
jgi:hypothetical protein